MSGASVGSHYKDDRMDNMSAVSTGGSQSGGERDEIEELQKFSRSDNQKLMISRIIATVLLLSTAILVTVTTYILLRNEQTESFKDGFAQFSVTLGFAAKKHQRTLKNNFQILTDSLSSDATRTNAVWPYYYNQHYENLAGRALRQSQAEIAAQFTRVLADERDNWVGYATNNYKNWVIPSHNTRYGNLDRLNDTYVGANLKANKDGTFTPEDDDEALLKEAWPMWLYSPAPASLAAVNWNLLTVPDYDDLVKAMVQLPGESIITKVRASVSTGTAYTHEEHDEFHSKTNADSRSDHPHSFLWTPMYEEIGNRFSKLVGLIATGFAWDAAMRDLLPINVAGITVVVANNCDQSYSYRIDGKDAFFTGVGDLHEREYSDMLYEENLSLLTTVNASNVFGHCVYKLKIYPSREFEMAYTKSNTPLIFALIVMLTFVVVAIAFVVYDILVQRRNQNIFNNAARSNAVISSLFPGTLRDRVLEQSSYGIGTNDKTRMKSLLTDGEFGKKGLANIGGTTSSTKPLADLFLETTIMFADISGFTAWSSVRQPSLVFQLLESVYSAFDELAARRNVLKIETVGDCYVAASGIPDYRADHAISMIRFANDCISCMTHLVKRLETSLGPGTAELAIRIGINSGPVTAGVLRGKRSRFQLFGVTMNTTAHVESTGERNRIHISQSTADLVIKCGKESWLKKRDTAVVAKGKGELQTYWVNLSNRSSNVSFNNSISNNADGEKHPEFRLVAWNCEVLGTLLKHVSIDRQKRGQAGLDDRNPSLVSGSVSGISACPLDYVKEVINFPQFDGVFSSELDIDAVQLNSVVTSELKDYVSTIAYMYKSNEFHCFEHASHVTMSVIKLLSRIVCPEISHSKNATDADLALMVHKSSFGISNSLTQFTCALAALIHDVDHPGVPNPQLMRENPVMADKYNRRSPAEQNSLDLSYDLLQEDRFRNLRHSIYSTEKEQTRFKELLINSVMATDIADKNLKAARNARWEKAFDTDDEDVGSCDESTVISTNRKATIVIEHLIQASDVSHTMQHWHVYRKWNERLFREMFVAHRENRNKVDPSSFWYRTEMGFFDFYVIPLANKLKSCGVFGVSSGEFLNYANANRAEWESRGEEIVAEMIEKLNNEDTVDVKPETFTYQASL